MTQCLLGPGKIIEFESTFPQARPRKPVLRILLYGLLEYRHSFIAAASLVEGEPNLYVRSYQILGHRTVPRRILVGHSEDG